ncbi:DUF2752 domain-containing protein [Streptomyces reniochalinae]|uniref:DUF2752 domain-containing protein n=1 Tax=Streptomyces reniochalinae TaxID=2250578 RepID=UPI001FE24AFD|nr:DUF2752 domain-containing protein [Streptomyces reniochalinae]
MRHRLTGAVPRLAAPLGSLAAVGAAFVYVAAVDPNQPGHYPACPFLAVTGLYCPACGGLRSAHAVAHGDVVTALGANAAAVLLFAVLALGWLYWTIRAAGARSFALPVRPRVWHAWAAGVLLAAFTVVRNTPLGTALTP